MSDLLNKKDTLGLGGMDPEHRQCARGARLMIASIQKRLTALPIMLSRATMRYSHARKKFRRNLRGLGGCAKTGH